MEIFDLIGSVVKTVSPFVPVVNVVPAANDIVSDFNGKKFTLGHTGKTAIDVMGLMPVVGAIAKKGSKAKDVVKVVDEITDIGKGVDNASDASKAAKIVNVTVKAKSLIKNDPGLIKAAEEMGKNQAVQQEANNLINQFLNGNSNPGLGSKNLFKDISYLRGQNGARVFYRMKDGVMEILGKSSKANEQKVINILKKLYK